MFLKFFKVVSVIFRLYTILRPLCVTSLVLWLYKVLLLIAHTVQLSRSRTGVRCSEPTRERRRSGSCCGTVRRPYGASIEQRSRVFLFSLLTAVESYTSGRAYTPRRRRRRRCHTNGYSHLHNTLYTHSIYILSRPIV